MKKALLLALALAAALPGAPRAETPGTDPYSRGMALRRKGDYAGAKAVFLEMLAKDPKSGGAFEGLGLSCLSLKEYDQARDYLSRWNESRPNNGYILGLLARADSALERRDDFLADLRGASAADPLDLGLRRRLDDVQRERPGVLPEARMYKSLSNEGLETGNPQRVVYEGRSGGAKARFGVHPKADLLLGYSAREEAQRNDTGGFTYFDILEQVASVGVAARPRKGLDLEAEYGQSFLSDVHKAGVGRRNFSRLRLSGEWRAPAATVRLKAGREPYFLRGAGGSQYFALLREAYSRAEVESYRWGWGGLLRGGLDGYSDGTTLRPWSASAFKEFGANYLNLSYAQSHQEYSGAGADGRIRFAAYDRLGARWRWLREDVARVDAGYGWSRYRDGNRLHDANFGLALWMPRVKGLSAEYRVEAYDYLGPVDGYRSTDWTEHWAGPHWRRMHAPGVWTHLAAEHGWARDTRGAYEGNLALAELEYYWRERASLLVSGKLRRSTLRDESYSLGLSGRWSF